jgi:hypothetical protein
MRAIVLAAAFAGALAAGPALADAPMATAPEVGLAAPQPSAPAPPLAGPGATAPDAQPVAMGPCGPEKVRPDGSLETKPHGEVEAGVGTQGYRHFGGTVCQPIGQNAAVAVSISESQGNWGYQRR